MQKQPKSLSFKYWSSLLSILLLISACSKPQQETDPSIEKPYTAEAGGTMIDAMSGEPSNLIAMMAGESSASQIASNIFNSLLKYDKNLELTGELAQSWEVSKDQKTITFHL